jgi:hypothetical protein
MFKVDKEQLARNLAQTKERIQKGITTNVPPEYLFMHGFKTHDAQQAWLNTARPHNIVNGQWVFNSDRYCWEFELVEK